MAGDSWQATWPPENDKCECGAKGTVGHVLVDCPRLKDLRNILRRKIGSAFNNISDMLGGGLQGREGRSNGAAQDSSILGAVLDFAEASERFRSRGPERPQNRTPGT
jgi:hypothetical protein